MKSSKKHMKVENYERTERLKDNLKAKLKLDAKSYHWFWENKIPETGLSYRSFINSIYGYTGIKEDVEAIIKEYVGEKF